MKTSKLAITTLICFTAFLSGCATSTNSYRMNQVSGAYHQRQYQRSYTLASTMADLTNNYQSYIAAYYAGMSAKQMRRPANAEHYLLIAMRSENKSLSGDAAAALGLLYSKYGHYQAAVWAFKNAATKLTGESQAHALFYEAIAQQKLGATSTARANLIIARSKTNSPSLINKIHQRMSVTGYTIQVGAYTSESRARDAAQQWARKVAPLNIGMPRLVESNSHTGKTILVQIGQFTSYDSARDAKKKLNDQSAIIATLAN